MHLRRFWIALPGILLAGTSAAPAAELAPGNPSATALVPDTPAESARALAATIDRLIAAKWEATGTQPAAPVGDAEFLRRVTLDLTGKIPTAAQARDFLDDDSADKRDRLVERLLESPGYAAHMANTWKALLLPEVTSNFLLEFFATDFDPWLRKKFAENAGFDAIVREILTVALPPNRQGLPIGQGAPTPYAFLAAKEGKPENLAASTARVFLGLHLECAQCHDHPFARWKRDQFWSYAAFFGGIERVGNGDGFFQGREILDRRELAVPGTDRVVQAGFLDGSEPDWRPRVGARVTLADWMTAPGNPYFARSAANRAWAQLFGTGLVDPVDDLDPSNAPSHPELLDSLARQFVAHGFDLKFLFRAIASSRAYQLSSAGYAPGQVDARLFARMPIRGMTPQQLYESLVQASGLRREPESPPFFLAGNSPRKEFLTKFASQDEKPTEHQTSILQVLTLMNGRLMADATSLKRGGTLPAVAEAPFLDTPGKIEAFYLAVLTRRPRPEERDRLVAYVEGGGPAKDPKEALADVFWALLNGAEFTLIH
jgi:hypothetical protein